MQEFFNTKFSIILRNKTAFCLTTIICGLSSSALAQTSLGSAVFKNVDDNGVDLSSGTYSAGVWVGSVGSDESELSLVHYFGGGAINSDNLSITLYRSTTGTAVKAVKIRLMFGNRSENFTGTPSSIIFTSQQGNGATLSKVGSESYLYTSADGTKIVFGIPADLTIANSGPLLSSPKGAAAFCTTNNETDCGLLGINLTHPNGRRIDYNWRTSAKCTTISTTTGQQMGCAVGNRITNIISNSGYRIAFSYVTDISPNNELEKPNWEARSTATFSNTNLAGAPLTANFSYPASNITEITDVGGRLWRVTQTTGATPVLRSYVTGVKKPSSAVDNVTVAYAPSSMKVTQVVADGVTTNYNYVVSGTTTTMAVTDAMSQQTVVTSVNGRPTAFRDPLNRTTNYTYDANLRLTSEAAPEGNATTYGYDSRGNVTTKTMIPKVGTGLPNIITSADYPATCANPVICNKPTWTKDGNGNQTDYTYDATHGGVLTVTAPAAANGGVRPQTRYAYSAVGAVTLPVVISTCQTGSSCSGSSDEVKTTISYNSNHLTTSITKASGDAAVSATYAVSYDDIGNRVGVDGPLPGATDTTQSRYDNARQLVGVIGPDPDGAGFGRIHAARRITYNADGKVTLTEIGTVADQSDAAWQNFSSVQQVAKTYDAKGRLIKKEIKAGSTTYGVSQASYDSLGRVDCTVERIDPAQWTGQADACVPQTTNNTTGPDRVTKNIYDAASEMIQVQAAVGTADAFNEVTTTYTNNGKVATLKDGENNLTTYSYDGHDRLSQTRYPVANLGGVSSSTTDYEQLSYDANRNVTQRRLRDGQLINFSYDNLNRVTFKDVSNIITGEFDVTYGYDLLARLTSMNNSSSVPTSMTYDALGRMMTESTNGLTKTMGYDVAGRMTSLTYPGGSLVVNYDFDVTNNVTSIRENGATSGIGVLATYAYDNLLRLSSVTFGNGVVQSYAFDPVSRLQTLTSNLAGTAQDQTASFTYNSVSQIDTLIKNNDAYSWNGHYNIDRPSVANGLNQLTSAGAITLGYDLRGNLNVSGAASFGYTSENRLATMQSVVGETTLSYDLGGRLWQVIQGSVTKRFDYSGSNLLAESDASENVQRRYVYGPGSDRPIIWYEGNGLADRRFLLADERGSIVAETNSSGNAIAINSYDEYGIPATSNIGRFQYAGQAWLPEIGMYYYKARIYSPTLGRFLQTDPIGYGDGINMYAYVGSDPINRTDPTGLKWGKIGGDDNAIIVTGTRTTNPAQSSNDFIIGSQLLVANLRAQALAERRAEKKNSHAENAQVEQDNCSSSGINRLVADNLELSAAITRIDSLGSSYGREYGFVARGNTGQLDIGPITTGARGLWVSSTGFSIMNFLRLNGNAIVFHSHYPAKDYDPELSPADITNGDGWGEAMSVSIQMGKMYCSRNSR